MYAENDFGWQKSFEPFGHLIFTKQTFSRKKVRFKHFRLNKCKFYSASLHKICGISKLYLKMFSLFFYNFFFYVPAFCNALKAFFCIFAYPSFVLAASLPTYSFA